MRPVAAVAAMLALLPSGAGSTALRANLPPQIVGPRALPSGSCPVVVTTPGGKSAGREIPIPALRLGAPVERNATSFPTGGSGTANATLAWQREKAGLQAYPKTFDAAAPGKPSVFAVERAQVPVPQIYQRLPLKSAGTAYGQDGMIFAQATSPTGGRIASLMLMLAEAPSARPALTIAGASPTHDGCQADNPIQVYAPAMTVPQLRELFTPTGCNWNRLADCTRAEQPRGRVLFVQKWSGASFYEYRWVDYDLLASVDGRLKG